MTTVCLYSNSSAVYPPGCLTYRKLLFEKLGQNLKCICEAGVTVCEGIRHFDGGIFNKQPNTFCFVYDKFENREIDKYIVNLGIVESETHRLDNFCSLARMHINRFQNPLAGAYLSYKLDIISEKKDQIVEFISMLTEKEFEFLYYSFISKLVNKVGSENVLLIGLVMPNKKQHRYETFVKYNNILKKISQNLKINFIDCSLIKSRVITHEEDDRHFSIKGHQEIFNIIINNFLKELQ